MSATSSCSSRLHDGLRRGFTAITASPWDPRGAAVAMGLSHRRFSSVLVPYGAVGSWVVAKAPPWGGRRGPRTDLEPTGVSLLRFLESESVKLINPP